MSSRRATAQGGAATLSLERLAQHLDPTPLPLDQLSQALPFSTFGLFELALLVDQRRLAAARAAGADATTIAELLGRVSARADNAGDRDAALASITEAVEHYRRAGRGQPRRLPARPRRVAEQPRPTGRPAPGTGTPPWPPSPRPSTIYRRLAGAEPRRLPARPRRSLNNLVEPADRHRGPGRRPGLHHRSRRRTTAAWPRPTPPPTCPTSPVAEQPRRSSRPTPGTGTAPGLHHRGRRHPPPAGRGQPRRLPARPRHVAEQPVIRQADTGDRDAALASITEAVDIRRRLAAANPAAYLPDLAESLNNLSIRQSDTGDRDGALASINEAVDIHRRLAAGQPRRLPARPRRVAEQPVHPAGRHRGPGRRAGLHHRGRRHPPPAGRRPTPPPTCPTSPCR